MEKLTLVGIVITALGLGMLGWSLHNPDVPSCIQNYFNSTESRVEIFNRTADQKHKAKDYSQIQLTPEGNSNLHRDVYIGTGGILVSSLGCLLLLGSAVSYGKTTPQFSASSGDAGGGARRRGKLFVRARDSHRNVYTSR